MGCNQSALSQEKKYEKEREKCLLGKNHHYNSNLIHQPILPNKLKTQDQEGVYKAILSSFQLKAIPLCQEILLDAEILPDMKKDPGFLQLRTQLISESQTWPLNTLNSFFVFFNEGNPSHLKVFITGPESTPYAHGLFEFDIIFKDSLKNPPKVKFLTTGNHKVCFGPRLSNSGKVKLPLLGTAYARHKEELWSSQRKISEILFSLQGLIKTNNICEGDLELESLKEDENARRRLNKACGNIVKYCNIQFAMMEYINSPIPWLKNFAHTYFYLKKNIILKEVKKWLSAAQQDDGYYEGLASLYNLKYAAELRKGNYFDKLSVLVQTLEKELNDLKINTDSPILQKFCQS